MSPHNSPQNSPQIYQVPKKDQRADIIAKPAFKQAPRGFVNVAWVSWVSLLRHPLHPFPCKAAWDRPHAHFLVRANQWTLLPTALPQGRVQGWTVHQAEGILFHCWGI